MDSVGITFKSQRTCELVRESMGKNKGGTERWGMKGGMDPNILYARVNIK